jgi:hypothetical protein
VFVKMRDWLSKELVSVAVTVLVDTLDLGLTFGPRRD